jgi:hypothetical protein
MKLRIYFKWIAFWVCMCPSLSGCNKISPESFVVPPADRTIPGSVRVALVGIYDDERINKYRDRTDTSDVYVNLNSIFGIGRTVLELYVNGVFVRERLKVATRAITNAYLTIEIPGKYLPVGAGKLEIKLKNLTDTANVGVGLLSFEFDPTKRILIRVDSISGPGLNPQNPYLVLEDLTNLPPPSPGKVKIRLLNRGNFTARLLTRNPESGVNEVLISGVSPGTLSDFIETEQGYYTTLRITDQDENNVSSSLPVPASLLQGGGAYTVSSDFYINIASELTNYTGLGLDAAWPVTAVGKLTLVHAQPFLPALTAVLPDTNFILNYGKAINKITTSGIYPVRLSPDKSLASPDMLIQPGDIALAFLLPKPEDSLGVQLFRTNGRTTPTQGYLVRFINLSPDTGPVMFTTAASTGLPNQYLDYIPDTLRMSNRAYLETGVYRNVVNQAGDVFRQASDPYAYFTTPPNIIRVRRYTGSVNQPGEVVFANPVSNPFAAGPGVYTVVLIGSSQYRQLAPDRYTRLLVFRHTH